MVETARRRGSYKAWKLESLPASRHPSFPAFNDNAEALMKAILKTNRGIALVTVVMIVAILLSITGGALLLSGINLRTAANLKTGSGAIHIADAGIQHGLALIPSGTDFNSLLAGSVAGFPCAPSSPCDGITKQPKLTGSLSGYTYTVVAENDISVPLELPLNDVNKVVTLSSTASGPNNSSQRKIKAYIGRSTNQFIPPGAIYVPGGPTSFNEFEPTATTLITGNDTNFTNTAGPAAPILGLAVTDPTVKTNIINGLSDAEKARIQGQGFSSGPPVVASVNTTGTQIDINQLAQNFINQLASAITCPPKCLDGLQTSFSSTSCPNPLTTPRPVPDPCILGTDAAPQITYIKEGTNHAHLDGNVTGSGVLVIEGKAHLLGDLNFHGLVIIKEVPVTGTLGEEIEVSIKGNARIYGATLLGPGASDLELEIKNNAAVRYSSQGLDIVRNHLIWGPLLPKAAKLIAWHEVMQ